MAHKRKYIIIIHIKIYLLKHIGIQGPCDWGSCIVSSFSLLTFSGWNIANELDSTEIVVSSNAVTYLYLASISAQQFCE